jgi:hypothetical protein
MSEDLAYKIYHYRSNYNALVQITQRTSIYMFIYVKNNFSFSDHVMLDIIKALPVMNKRETEILINQCCDANLKESFIHLLNNYIIDDQHCFDILKLIISRDHHELLSVCLTSHRTLVGNRMLNYLTDNSVIIEKMKTNLSYKCYEVLLNNELKIYFENIYQCNLFFDLIQDHPSDDSIGFFVDEYIEAGKQVNHLPPKFIDRLITEGLLSSSMMIRYGRSSQLLSMTFTVDEFKNVFALLTDSDLAIKLFDKHKHLFRKESLLTILHRPSLTKALDHIITSFHDKELILEMINILFDDLCSDRNSNIIYCHVPVLVKHWPNWVDDHLLNDQPKLISIKVMATLAYYSKTEKSCQILTMMAKSNKDSVLDGKKDDLQTVIDSKFPSSTKVKKSVILHQAVWYGNLDQVKNTVNLMKCRKKK